jgi:alpha-beta hydrolase superfamily lysophospholipase
MVGVSAGWFGDSARRRFGWLHLPNSGQARAGVVLCPPFGLEYLATHRTYRVAARQLASAGFAVLRFDWFGTGDSFGTLDDASVDGWLDDIGAAVARVKGAGVVRTAVVGMRLGATLAAAAVDRGLDTDALVAWDPCRSGGSFLREQRALYAMSAQIAPADDDAASESAGVETLGFVYPEALAKELRSLDVSAIPPPARVPTLVLSRADRPIDKHVVAWAKVELVDEAEAAGQAELLDVGPSEAKVPHGAIDRITEWLGNHFDDAGAPVSGSLDASTVATGPAIAERVTALGPLGLFGIETEPERAPDDAAMVIFVPVAAEHRVGPGRMWVELARELAARGYRSLRFDFSGLGDSPTRPGQPENWVYTNEALDDIDDVLDVVAPSAPGGMVLVGLCSGAHAAMRAVARRKANGGPAAAVQSVCALNPFLWYGGKPYLASEPYEPSLLVAPVKSWMRVHVKDRLRRFGDTLPEPLWTAITRTPLTVQPTKVPSAVVELGVDLLLVLEAGDAETLQRRFPAALRELEDTGRFHLEAPDAGDHSLFATRPREHVRRLVREHIEAVVPPSNEP